MRLSRKELKFLKEEAQLNDCNNFQLAPHFLTLEYRRPIAILAQKLANYPIKEKVSINTLTQLFYDNELWDFLSQQVPNLDSIFEETNKELGFELDSFRASTAVSWAYGLSAETEWRSFLPPKAQ
jgi:hypothetical protein